MASKKPALFADNFMFLEAPKWRDDRLWVSDVFDHKVCALSADGHRKTLLYVPNRPSGLGFLADGSLIVVSAKDSRLLRYSGDQLSEYADLSSYTTGWLNDFAIDDDDRIYVGNFGYDFDAGEARKTTSLHRVDPDGTIEVVANDMDFPNGSVVIDDGKTLVVAETWEARLTAFDIDERGRLSNRRLFADLGKRQPDGICADAEGAIWTGIYNTGEFLRVLDGGKVTDTVNFDGSGISCTLGGVSGKTLFMTAVINSEKDMANGNRNSAVYTLDVDVPAARGGSPS